MYRFSALIGILGYLSMAAPARLAADDALRVEFNRDIRPILSNNCFTCHGPDEQQRQADLRLDTEDGLYGEREAGRAIVPGNTAESVLYQRITSADEAERMPPADSDRTLTEQQKELIRRWIEQGAEHQGHWSFIPPQRPSLPAVSDEAWVQNPIDRFVLSRLDEQKLPHSAEADRASLLRRVTLDLTGLPPTLEELDAFLADDSPDAYLSVVERLLNCSRYGEHMARYWLDAARYGDTHGLHLDNQRSIWPYRQWVISAFNRNLPFDQFTIWQLAGDLLPDRTLEQQIATGFSRCNVTTSEGGAIPEEYRVKYGVDRVDTMSTVWMGLTAGCAVCHDHKFDPITQKEFYQLYAYFNQLDENPMDGNALLPPPVIKVPTPDEQSQLDALQQAVVATEEELQARDAGSGPEQAAWETERIAQLAEKPAAPSDAIVHLLLDEGDGATATNAGKLGGNAAIEGKVRWSVGKHGQALRLDGSTYAPLPSVGDFEHDSAFSYGAWAKAGEDGAMAILARMDDGNANRGYDLYLADGHVYVHLIHQWPDNSIRVQTEAQFPLKKWHHFFATYDGSGKAAGVAIYVDGQRQATVVTHDNLSGTIRTDKAFHVGRREPGSAYQGLIDDVRVFDRALCAEEAAAIAASDPIDALLALPSESRAPEQLAVIHSHYLNEHDAAYKKLGEQLATARQKEKDLQDSIPGTLVMQDAAEPRETFALVRGEYDRPGEKVTPGVPASLPPLPADAPANRLGLARWLVDRGHPLTARVAVNRYWQHYFGRGLVATAEDFGSQGEWPSHPALLDWLAVEFIDSGWDIRHLQRLIVTSATYRQSAQIITPEVLSKDPQNRFYTRGPRFRMDAEMVRDNALALSGLLIEHVGGPSVKPYQPEGLWEAVGYTTSNTAKFQQDKGASLYRRSMYTFWKRTSSPPSMSIFDAPSRESCTVRRARTNTPLQALVLMNDKQFVEAARHFARRMMLEGGSTPEDRIALGFRLATARHPDAGEMDVLATTFREFLAEFQQDPEGASQLVAVGDSPRDETLDPVEHAAWTMVASLILNLDETVTKG